MAAATFAARRLSFFLARWAWRTARREANNAGASSASPAASPGAPAGVLDSRRGTAAAGRTRMAVTAEATACTVLRGAPAWHAARMAAARSDAPSTAMMTPMRRAKGTSLLQQSLEPGLRTVVSPGSQWGSPTVSSNIHNNNNRDNNNKQQRRQQQQECNYKRTDSGTAYLGLADSGSA